jgi:membrane protease subunit HflK
MLLETLIYDEETKMFWNIQRGGPWGGSGGNGGGQGPWGGGSSGNQPPDLEEMLRRSQDKFKKFIPSGKGGPRRIILLILVAAVIWLGTGFYRVQPSEQGVELLFGKFVKTTTPGLNYWFPAPIGQVFRPDVTNTNITSVGFRQIGTSTARNSSVRDIPEESLMLTGDQNIIDIDYQVQWRIKNAADFLFNIRNPEETVKLASESAIREIIGQNTLEDALAKQRQQVESQTHEVLQKILDSYGAGVFIDSVKLH